MLQKAGMMWGETIVTLCSDRFPILLTASGSKMSRKGISQPGLLAIYLLPGHWEMGQAASGAKRSKSERGAELQGPNETKSEI